MNMIDSEKGKRTQPRLGSGNISRLYGREEAFVSPKGPKQVEVSRRERIESKEGGRERLKEISYRDREEEDKDDSWPGTSSIWQG